MTINYTGYCSTTPTCGNSITLADWRKMCSEQLASEVLADLDTYHLANQKRQSFARRAWLFVISKFRKPHA